MILCIKSVEASKGRFDFKSLLKHLLVLAVMLFMMSLYCHAEVYKCTDARGRTLIGDQPCPIKDTPVNPKKVVKEPIRSASKEEIKQEKVHESVLLDALEQKIQLKHGYECRELRIQLKKNGHFSMSALAPSAVMNKSDGPIWEQYRTACIAQANDVFVLDQAQKENAGLEKARKAACDTKVKDYERRKLMLSSSSSDQEVNAFNILQTEVLRGCR